MGQALVTGKRGFGVCFFGKAKAFGMLHIHWEPFFSSQFMGDSIGKTMVLKLHVTTHGPMTWRMTGLLPNDLGHLHFLSAIGPQK